MANNGKFINLENGKLKQNDAVNVSTGASDVDKIVKLDSSGRLSETMMPVGVAADVKVVVASENLTAGQYVNFWNNGGVETVRLADATNGRDAHGYVKEAFLTAANATVYFEGANDDLSGLTPGARYYLDAAGGVTSTPRTTGLHQLLGIAISPTEINTDIDDCVVL
jgi:hypothetical protein